MKQATQAFMIDCGNGRKFQIYVHPGQAINRGKMCRKLLKTNFEELTDGNKKSFISKGYKGQRR